MNTFNPEPYMLAITTTSDQRTVLERLADRLIQQQVAACCQVEGPFTSRFRWQGQVESSQEYRLLIKTFDVFWDQVVEIIRQDHNYDQPQIVGQALGPVETGYLEWARQSVAPMSR